MTRDEAVDRLTAWGYYARPRNWVMGETIFLGMGQREELPHNINAVAAALYIYPKRDNPDKWGVTDCNYIDRTYDSLSKAVDGAHVLAEFLTPYIRSK